MAAINVESQSDFYDHQIYLSSSLDDFEASCQILKILKSEGYKVQPKYDPRNRDRCLKDSLVKWIGRSYMCILYYTPKYENDLFLNEETVRFLRKFKQFSDKSILVLSKKSISGSPFPAKLQEFIKFKVLYISDNSMDWPDDFKTIVFPYIEETLKEESDVKPMISIDDVYAVGMAFNYYYGYLHLVLPNMEKAFKDSLNNDSKKIKSSVSKLFIIVPEDCKAPINLADGEHIFNTDMFVNCSYNRAGVMKRDYKSSIYRIEDHNDGKDYLFIGEFATPLLTLYEAKKHFLSDEKIEIERDIFIRYLKFLLSHPGNVTDKAVIVPWRNITSNSEPLHSILLNLIKEELNAKKLDADGYPLAQKVTHKYDPETAKKVDVPFGKTPKALYDVPGRYDLKQATKGRCLAFVYNKCYNLDERKGWEHDKKNIETLFGELRFEVEVLVDCSSKQLEDACLRYQTMDHSQYGAFVCCIASHGENGYISTTDSKFEIIKIMEFFYEDVCATLKNKIKLFFVNCCLEENDARQPEKKASADQQRSNVKFNLAPSCKNMFISYSCLPAQPSYRFSSVGSLYFKCLTQTFRENYGEEIKQVMLALDENIKLEAEIIVEKIRNKIESLDTKSENYKDRYDYLLRNRELIVSTMEKQPQVTFYIETGEKLIYLDDRAEQ